MKVIRNRMVSSRDRKLLIGIGTLSFLMSVFFVSTEGAQLAYDDLHRLTTVTYENSMVIQYTYDAAGNRLSKVKTIVDTDADGITDGDEVNIYGTDPNNADTDEDGINDGDELAYWGTNWNVDYDFDGLNNLVDADADNDGFSDGEELDQGTDPSKWDSIRAPIQQNPVPFLLLLD